MSLQTLQGFTGYNQLPAQLVPQPQVYGPAKVYDRNMFQEPYIIPQLPDDYSFRWEIPTPMTTMREIVRDEIVKYEASSDFKPLTFIPLPKSFNKGLYEQMRNGNQVYYRRPQDQNKSIDIASLWKQTKLTTTPMLNMNSLKNAKSTSSIQNSQQG